MKKNEKLALSQAQDAVPFHIAIVMDGNGRWASKRFMPRLIGHKQGVDSLKRCVRACSDRGIGVLSVFAFSSENWSRPTDEVQGLLDLMAKALSRELSSLHSEHVQMHFVGNRQSLSASVCQSFQQAEDLTRNNTGLVLNVCFNYGGRWDIVQAAANLAAQGKEITEESISQALALRHVPDPDLLIRTGDETRISNFMLWQCAYSELYFTETLWPDFDERALDLAIADFARRERRFGKTSAQVQARKGAAC